MENTHTHTHTHTKEVLWVILSNSRIETTAVGEISTMVI